MRKYLFLAKFHDISLSLIELGNNCWVVVVSGHFKPKYFSTEAILYTHGWGSRMGVYSSLCQQKFGPIDT